MVKNLRIKELAKERIDILIACALREKDEDLAGRQAGLAKKVAMRYRVRLPYEARQLFCKRCKAFIVPGKTARIRLGRSRTKALRITCLKCGHIYRKILARPE